MTTSLVFTDIELQTVDLKIGANTFVLTEATEKEAKDYRNFMIGKAKMKKGQTVGYGDIGDSQSYLLSLLIRDASGKKVLMEDIGDWPSRIVQPIFEEAKRISGLDTDEEDKKDMDNTEAKNS
tara:strand:+ start:4723 stop:5091 length:369 start_codon:yes stop_codon:yes gene_type:complete